MHCVKKLQQNPIINNLAGIKTCNIYVTERHDLWSTYKRISYPIQNSNIL